MPQTVHVYPNNDLIEHDTDGGDCPCGPTSEPVSVDTPTTTTTPTPAHVTATAAV